MKYSIYLPNKYYAFIRMLVNRFTKTITIHTEAIHNDCLWKKIREFASKNKAEWFVFTPVNFGLAKHMFGFNGTKKQYEKIILKRYKWLKDHNQKIQLHIHLTYFPSTISDKKCEQMIVEGFNWLKSNGFNPDKIVFGWWVQTSKSQDVAEKLGLKIVGYFDYYWFHDYDLIKGYRNE